MNRKVRIRFGFSCSDNRKSKIQNRKWAGFGILIIILVMCGNVAQAQQPTKIPRVGHVLAASPSSVPARTEAYRQGLRELGYVEGKNIVIEWRSAEGKLESLPALLAEIVRLKVEVIVSGGPESTRAAQEAT